MDKVDRISTKQNTTTLITLLSTLPAYDFYLLQALIH